MSTEKFECYGVVELFGHQTIAGKISEATIGGCSFVRVDVPNADQSENAESPWAYTRYFGQGAIYALNPTSEAVARVKARGCQEPPFAYDVNHAAVAAEVDRRMKTLAHVKPTPPPGRVLRENEYPGDPPPSLERHQHDENLDWEQE